MPVVKPEFGPTLPELVGPRLRSWPRWGRVAFWASLALVALVVLWALLLRSDGRETIVVREPIAFNLLKNDKLVRVQPRAGESLRLQSPASDPDPEAVVVRPVVLPPYSGDASGVLPVYASGVIERMAKADPHFALRSEGRARVNSQPGYQIQFQTSSGGRTVYGRRTLLFADEPGAREGVDITLTAARSPAIPNVDAVGSNGPTKLPVPVAAPRHRAPMSASAADRLVELRDFARIDMRVGRIVEVEDFPEARSPAWKLRVDFGPEIGVRRSSAQIRNYAREQLIDRLVIGVVNFPPRQIGPVRSEVLVLGSYSDEGVLLLAPEPSAALGDRVG